MYNDKLLKDYILKSGLKRGFIASELDLTLQGLINKIEGASEFKNSEIYKISNLLKLSSDEVGKIFFNDNIELNS